MARPNRHAATYATLISLLVLSILSPMSPAAADTFSNTSPIAIPLSAGACGASAKAVPYPSPIQVSGLAQLADVNVTLTLTHTVPDDVGILLVGPQGDEVLLMADAGGGTAAAGLTLTFDDAAAGPLPDSGPLASGTFTPTLGSTGPGCSAPTSFPIPAPAGPYPTSLAGFRLTDPNGTWQLFVIDDTAAAAGAIAGWSLELTQAEPYLKVAVVGAGHGSVTAQGIACPPDCAEHAQIGTPFFLHATASPGSVFAGWSGDCAGTSPDCDLILNLTTIVGARFEPATTPPPVPSADVSVEGAVGVTAQVGSPVALTFDVRNAGPNAATGVSLTVSLPEHTELSHAPAGCSASTSELSCPVGDLAVNAAAQVTVELIPSRGDPFTVTASVTSALADGDLGDNSTTVPVDPLAKCTVNGTGKADTLEGTNGIDVICGGAGADVLLGLDGDDILRAGPGADELHASLGDDLVLGGGGADRIFGGQGTDACDTTAEDEASGCERRA